MTPFLLHRSPRGAYMAKHFGMRFLLEDEEFEEWGAEIHELWPDFDGGTEVKYHVHPDSLHLLEMHAGDVLQFESLSHLQTVMVVAYEDSPLIYEQILPITFVLEEIGEEFRIIQRNGIAFHWPEKSCAESALKKAKRQTEKSTTEIMTDDDSQSLNPHLFETLNG